MVRYIMPTTLFYEYLESLRKSAFIGHVSALYSSIDLTAVGYTQLLINNRVSR